MPKGTEFGSEATQLSAPQGAGAQPLQGVQSSSYTPNLAPIANLLEGGISLFDKFKKGQAEEASNTILQNLAEEVDKVDQGRITNALSVDEAARKKKLIYMQYRRNYPGMVEDFKKQASFDKEFGVASEINADMDSARKQEETNIAAANSRGIPVSIKDSPAVKKQALDLYQLSVRTEAGIKEARETAEYRHKELGWNREDAAAAAKAKSEDLLDTLGSSHFQMFSNRVNEAIIASQTGPLTDETKMGLRQYYQDLRGQITALSKAAPDLASKYMALFDGAWKDIEDGLKPGGDLKLLKDKVETMKTMATMKFFKEVQGGAEMAAMADMFKNHPALASINFAPVQSFLNNAAGLQENVQPGKPLEQIVGHPDRVAATLDGLKKMTKADTPEKRQQVMNAISNLVDQYHDAFLTGKLSPKERDAMFKTLSSPEMTTFIRENKLGPRMSSQLATMYDKAYVQEFQRNLQSKLFEIVSSDKPKKSVFDFFLNPDQDIATVNSQIKQFEDALRKDPTNSAYKIRLEELKTAATQRTKDRPIKDLVKIEHNGVGLTITPLTNGDMSSEAAREFEKASRSASNIVNIGAAIQRKDPKVFWEENKALFLPGMGYPPPKEVSRQNKEDESALKRELSTLEPGSERYKIVQNELDMASGKKNAPADTQGNQGIRNQADIAALEKELKTASPMVRSILEAELKRLKGQ